MAETKCPLLRCQAATKNIKQHIISTHFPRHFYSATPARITNALNTLSGMVVGKEGLAGLAQMVKQEYFLPKGHIIQEEHLGFFSAMSGHFGETIPPALELYPVNSESLLTHWAVLMQLLQAAGAEAQAVFQQISVVDAPSASGLPSETSWEGLASVSSVHLASQMAAGPHQLAEHVGTVSTKSLDVRRRQRSRRNKVRAQRRRAERKQRSEFVRLCPERGLVKTVLTYAAGVEDATQTCDATLYEDCQSNISLEVGEAEREEILGDDCVVPNPVVNGMDLECAGEPGCSIQPWIVRKDPEAIDAHFHLDRLTNKLKKQRVPVPNKNMASVLERGPQEHGKLRITLSHAVAVFCDERSQKILLQGSKTQNRNDTSVQYYQQLMLDQRMSFAFGLHPKAATTARPKVHLVIEQLRCLMKLPRAVALGEVGLDYSATFAEWKDQRYVLSAVLRELHTVLGRRPVVVHCREPAKMVPMVSEPVSALGDLMQIMQTELHPETPVQVHYFTGSRAEVDRWLAAFPNTYFSVGGAAMKLSKAQREGIAAIPDARLLLETDSPYDPPVRNRLNCSSPLLIGHIAEKVAAVRGTHWHQVLSLTVDNAKRLFNL